MIIIATACRHCDIGWFSVDGLSSSTCTKCPEGESTTGIGTAVKCNQCDVDYYSPPGSESCARCLDGFGTNGLKGQTLCSPLATPVPTASPPTPGPSDPTEKPTKRPTLTKRPSFSPTTKPTSPYECEVGSYSSTGFEPCTPCPEYSSNTVAGILTLSTSASSLLFLYHYYYNNY